MSLPRPSKQTQTGTESVNRARRSINATVPLMIADEVSYKFAGQQLFVRADVVMALYSALVEGPYASEAYAAIAKVFSDGQRWTTLHLRSAVNASQPAQVVLHEWVDGHLVSYRQFIEVAPKSAGWAPSDE